MSLITTKTTRSQSLAEISQSILSREQARFSDLSIGADRAFALALSKEGQETIKNLLRYVNECDAQNSFACAQVGQSHTNQYAGTLLAVEQIKLFCTRAMVISEVENIPLADVFTQLMQDGAPRCAYPLGYNGLEFIQRLLRADQAGQAEREIRNSKAA